MVSAAVLGGSAVTAAALGIAVVTIASSINGEAIDLGRHSFDGEVIAGIDSSVRDGTSATVAETDLAAVPRNRSQAFDSPRNSATTHVAPEPSLVPTRNKARAPSDEATNTKIGRGSETGRRNGSDPHRVAAAMRKLSSFERSKLRLKCRSVLNAPQRHDADAIALCRVVGRT
jgi:hypothetical protein